MCVCVCIRLQKNCCHSILSEKSNETIEERAEGILPGACSQSSGSDETHGLSEFYSRKGTLFLTVREVFTIVSEAADCPCEIDKDDIEKVTLLSDLVLAYRLGKRLGIPLVRKITHANMMVIDHKWTLPKNVDFPSKLITEWIPMAFAVIKENKEEWDRLFVIHRDVCYRLGISLGTKECKVTTEFVNFKHKCDDLQKELGVSMHSFIPIDCVDFSICEIVPNPESNSPEDICAKALQTYNTLRDFTSFPASLQNICFVKDDDHLVYR